jgi:hypothetical protein
MSRLSKEQKRELTVKLNGVEQRLKRTSYYHIWNEYVKRVFKAVGVYSFDELVNINAYEADDLILQFKDMK